jgi:hypothetical protein
MGWEDAGLEDTGLRDTGLEDTGSGMFQPFSRNASALRRQSRCTPVKLGGFTGRGYRFVSLLCLRQRCVTPERRRA